jgi:hypothetical protein
MAVYVPLARKSFATWIVTFSRGALTVIKNFDRILVFIALVLVAGPSFAGYSADSNSGPLHANETFGGGYLYVSIGNYAPSGSFQGVFVEVIQCNDATGSCSDLPDAGVDNLAPGQTVKFRFSAPPGNTYYVNASALFLGSYNYSVYFNPYTVGY